MLPQADPGTTSRLEYPSFSRLSSIRCRLYDMCSPLQSKWHGVWLNLTNNPADGLGPLLWSPLSEVPVLGRNIPYITTFFIYVILSIPTATVNNLGGFAALRFFQGFFGSPCLASGGASLQDMVTIQLTFGIVIVIC